MMWGCVVCVRCIHRVLRASTDGLHVYMLWCCIVHVRVSRSLSVCHTLNPNTLCLLVESTASMRPCPVPVPVLARSGALVVVDGRRER